VLKLARFAAGLALLAALGLPAAPALAGPPFQVDDPEPTPFRHYEIYVNSQFAHGPDGMSGTLPALEVNYGLLRNVQFAVTTQVAASRDAGKAPWVLGFGDTEVALKLRFMQEGAGRPQIAFYPAVVVPTGNAASGLGEGNTRLFLPLWAQKDVGRWTVFGGGGLWHNPGAGNRDYTFSGIAAQREVSESFSYGAEVFHSTPDTVGGTPSTGFSVGFVRGFDEHHKVLFSAGRSLRGTNALTTYAAYELYLGPRAAPHGDGDKDEDKEKQ
jgi:hypothetical protein